MMVVSDTYDEYSVDYIPVNLANDDNASAVRASTIKIEEFQKFMETVQCEKLSDADAKKLVRKVMHLSENDPCTVLSYGGFCSIMVRLVVDWLRYDFNHSL